MVSLSSALTNVIAISVWNDNDNNVDYWCLKNHGFLIVRAIDINHHHLRHCIVSFSGMDAACECNLWEGEVKAKEGERERGVLGDGRRHNSCNMSGHMGGQCPIKGDHGHL